MFPPPLEGFISHLFLRARRLLRTFKAEGATLAWETSCVFSESEKPTPPLHPIGLHDGDVMR